MTNKPRKDSNPKEKLRKILSKCKINNGCFEWVGSYFVNKKTKQKTYPYIYWKNKVWRGNRLVLSIHTGIYSTEKYALHKCDNKKCLNPKHLYWGTHSDNMKDASERGLLRQTKIKNCPYGHPYKGNNLRINKQGKRICLSCNAYRNRNQKIASENLFE